VKWDEIGVLIPFGVVGVVLGTGLLVNLPPEPMLIALAGFVFIFALRSLFNVHGEKPISRGWAVPAALTGGTVGALFGTGGPPYVIYLSHRIRDKSDLRATFSALFFTEGMTRIVSFLVAGLLMTPVWIAYFAALPVMLGALYLGGRVHWPEPAADDTAGWRAVAGVELPYCSRPCKHDRARIAAFSIRVVHRPRAGCASCRAGRGARQRNLRHPGNSPRDRGDRVRPTGHCRGQRHLRPGHQPAGLRPPSAHRRPQPQPQSGADRPPAEFEDRIASCARAGAA
jgi:hypothetical protein